MTRIQIDSNTVEQILSGEGPIELVDANGQMVGVVKRPPTADEIARARERSSQGGETLTWAQLMAKVRAEFEQ
jgi:hypothetical protein